MGAATFGQNKNKYMKVKVLKKTEPGQKTIKFHPGALHEQLGVPQGEKLPASKMEAAATGALGALAKKRANFAKNVLTGHK
jgi:hypothetical protein